MLKIFVLGQIMTILEFSKFLVFSGLLGKNSGLLDSQKPGNPANNLGTKSMLGTYQESVSRLLTLILYLENLLSRVFPFY